MAHGLTLSRRRSLPCRNQPIDLLCKSMDWFLYDWDLRHGRVNNDQLKSVGFTFLGAVVRRCSIKKSSEKFREIHRKTPVPESFCYYCWRLKACNFIKSRFLHRFFSSEFCKISSNTYLVEHLQTASSVLQ